MRKIFTLILIGFISVSCGVLSGDYPMTAFIVKNTSDKSISFTSSVIKYSQIMGTQLIEVPFTVLPNDSVIVRQTRFKKDTKSPQAWFRSFKIFPTDGIEMNDPKIPTNWVKSSKDNIPIYTFTLNK